MDHATTAAKDVDSTISDADIERARRQIGIPQRRHIKAFNRVANADSMRHFAFGLAGDDNPLWHEEEYAERTRWRSLIAHPLFVLTMGINETPAYSGELKPLFRGLFRGVGKYLSATKWTMYRPVYPGDVLFQEFVTSAIEEKTSSFAGTRSVIDSYNTTYVDRAGLPVAVREHSLVNAERGASKKTGKYSNVEKQSYSPEDIARIDAIYAAEERRGREKRYWEDVEIGERTVPIAKGPLTIVDIISRHIATGMADGYDIGPLRYAWRSRQKMPAFYTPDAWGVPQPQQRVHWDESRAQDLGLPTGYDYAIHRFAWMVHVVTNWMGDDGWMWRFEADLRRFNFLSDTQICHGEVMAKRIEDDRPVVDLRLWAENQRGETTTVGSATIMLPSREFGPVVLPTPPLDIHRRGAAIMDRHARPPLE